MEYILMSNDDILIYLKIIEDLKDLVFDVGKYIIEFVYGDIYLWLGLINK